MRKRNLFVCFFIGIMAIESTAQDEVPTIELEQIAEGFTAPLAGTHAGDGRR